MSMDLRIYIDVTPLCMSMDLRIYIDVTSFCMSMDLQIKPREPFGLF